MTEDQLLTEVLILAAAADVFAFHSGDSRRDKGKGFPDVVLVGRGRIVFAELKSATGSTTPEQTRWKWRIIEALGNDAYYQWRPSDIGNGKIKAVINSLSPTGASFVSA